MEINTQSPFASQRQIEEARCNEVAWKLAWLNPKQLANRKNLLQRVLDVYRSRFLPELKTRRNSLRAPNVPTGLSIDTSILGVNAPSTPLTVAALATSESNTGNEDNESFYSSAVDTINFHNCFSPTNRNSDMRSSPSASDSSCLLSPNEPMNDLMFSGAHSDSVTLTEPQHPLSIDDNDVKPSRCSISSSSSSTGSHSPYFKLEQVDDVFFKESSMFDLYTEPIQLPSVSIDFEQNDYIKTEDDHSMDPLMKTMSFELDTLSYALLTSIVGAAALLSIRNSKSPDIHPLLLNTQSDVSRLRHPEESAVYRSRMYPIGTPLCSTFDRSIRTLTDFYKAGGLEKHASCEFLAQENSEYSTYADINRQAALVYQGLRAFGQLEPQARNQKSFVGIYAKSSAYTVLTTIAMLLILVLSACHSNGLVTVPISSSATSSHISHVIGKTSLKLLLVDSDNLDRVLSLAKNSSLKEIVVLGKASADQKRLANNLGLDIIEFDQLEEKGNSATYEPVTVAANDIASIYFSSSDGKESKLGTILTQKNLLSIIFVPPHQKVTPNDRLFLNLPIVSFLGGSIAFGDQVNQHNDIDITASLAQIAKAKPTIFASDSSFLHQVKNLISSRYGKSFLFKRGYDTKKAYLEENRLVNDCRYDMLVFRSIRQNLFGGRLRLIYVEHDKNEDPELATFLRIVLSVQVLQTFNMPETSSSVTASMFYDYNADPQAKGAPLPSNEIKLIDVPEHSLTAEDKPNPRGEIWVRGNNVFAGYYGDETVTSEVLDADGWFATGYLGEVLPNGTFKIHGRK
ncbi:Long chain acyl-CoA synthetase 7, peroxisomal [Choanephora cucurbitarum]|uniref:Long chain acyl-CoA synthetase 7, peroxisomal n=1 Tax=Choanephora cucurbitarum TaxID=101091 RepID=A0A1C7NDV4_9FUNG|nr:Long chain acyl-CoA synthetase 7, peroxisomal [Choanephora cucurbitarum]